MIFSNKSGPLLAFCEENLIPSSGYYYGSTENLEKRLKEHNAGRQKYTKGRRPWILHYSETLWLIMKSERPILKK